MAVGDDRGLLARASFEHLRGLRDTAGRSLGELKSTGQDTSEAALISSGGRFADSRAQSALPTNAAALEQIVLHWPAIRHRVSTIRGAFVDRYGSERLRALDLWRIANAAVSVVSFNRLDAAPHSFVPVADAALFKACVGIKFALRHAEVARLGGNDALGAFPSSTSLLAYIERERLLIGPTQVCAGPAVMIAELVTVFVDGLEPDSAPEAEPFAFDVEQLLRYADLLAVWETVLLLERADGRAPPTADGVRLRRLCRTMLRDVCAAVDFAVTPDVELARRRIEEHLRLLLRLKSQRV
jgi:hypothetical protein